MLVNKTNFDVDAPSCFVKGECVRLRSWFSLCGDCVYRCQSRLTDFLA